MIEGEQQRMSKIGFVRTSLKLMEKEKRMKSTSGSIALDIR